jgi:WD40 repeat protein
MRAPLHFVFTVPANPANWVVDVIDVPETNEYVCLNTTLNHQVSFHDSVTLQTKFHMSSHTANLTDINVTSNGTLVISSSRDGTVQTYDRRTNARGPTFRCTGGPILSCASYGTLVVAAEGECVWFFDLRTGRPMRRFDESHSEEVNVVRFGCGGALHSGGADGLVCVYDTSIADGEQDQFECVKGV